MLIPNTLALEPPSNGGVKVCPVTVDKCLDCQSASKRDPLSACKRGPLGGVALGLMPGADFALGLA